MVESVIPQQRQSEKTSAVLVSVFFDMSSSHPSNAWNSSPSHLARFVANISTSSLLFITSITLLAPVLLQRGYYPLKAHGIHFLLFKLFSLVFLSIYFATLMPLTRQWISLFISFMPLILLFPTILRCLHIFMTFQITAFQIELSSIRQKVDRSQLLQERHSWLSEYNTLATAIKRKRTLQNKFFLSIVFLILFLVHFILYVPVLPLFYILTESIYCILYAYAVAALTSSVYAIVIFVLITKIFQTKCREEFLIVKGIVANAVILALVLILLLIYASLMIAQQITEGNLRLIFYASMIPLDIMLQALFWLDAALMSTIVPLLHTFFFFSYYNSKGHTVDGDSGDRTGKVIKEDVIGKEDLILILSNEEMRMEFKKFAASEFSIENVLFYERYNQLKPLLPYSNTIDDRKPKEQKRSSWKRLSIKFMALAEQDKEITREELFGRLEHLFDEFIDVNGTMPLNITLDQCEKARNAIVVKRDIIESQIVLSQVLESVKSVMIDTFKRFCVRKQKIIEEWKKRIQIEKEVKEKLGWELSPVIQQEPSGHIEEQSHDLCTPLVNHST